MIVLSQLAKLLGAEFQAASGDPEIAGVSSIGQARPDTLVFAEDGASFATALASPAAAVLVSAHTAGQTIAEGKPRLLCRQPRLAFALAAEILSQQQAQSSAGPLVHPTAVIAESVQLEEDVSIGAYAVLEEMVRIGRGSRIESGVVLGKGTVIGARCKIYPRVVVYAGTRLGDRVVVHAGAVLGGDGFGYVRDQQTGRYIQFPQQGRLVLEDDVEIGANTTIDRGALEETRIARGSKIDNLVHIGHNVSVGSDVVIAAQCGISGSSSIGKNAVLGGQVGIGDHAFVGDGVILGGQAGILPNKRLRGAGILFWGTPAQPVKRYLRQLASLARLGRPANGAQPRTSPEPAEGE